MTTLPTSTAAIAPAMERLAACLDHYGFSTVVSDAQHVNESVAIEVSASYRSQYSSIGFRVGRLWIVELDWISTPRFRRALFRPAPYGTDRGGWPLLAMGAAIDSIQRVTAAMAEFDHSF